MQRTFSARPFVRPARILAVLVALGSTGCLLLSGRPVLFFGEECKAAGDCPSFGFCASTSSGNVCLPNAAECKSINDPVCGGYACEMSYSVANAYCERYCRASADCATGYQCDFADGSEGNCQPL
jgi:hypothetical protein